MLISSAWKIQVCLSIRFHFHTHLAKQFNEEVYIQDVRDIFDCNFFGGEQYGADDLQGFVLCALRV